MRIQPWSDWPSQCRSLVARHRCVREIADDGGTELPDDELRDRPAIADVDVQGHHGLIRQSLVCATSGFAAAVGPDIGEQARKPGRPDAEEHGPEEDRGEPGGRAAGSGRSAEPAARNAVEVGREQRGELEREAADDEDRAG